MNDDGTLGTEEFVALIEAASRLSTTPLDHGGESDIGIDEGTRISARGFLTRLFDSYGHVEPPAQESTDEDADG